MVAAKADASGPQPLSLPKIVQYCRSPLWTAFTTENMRVVKLLLSLKADPSAQTPNPDVEYRDEQQHLVTCTLLEVSADAKCSQLIEFVRDHYKVCLFFVFILVPVGFSTDLIRTR